MTNKLTEHTALMACLQLQAAETVRWHTLRVIGDRQTVGQHVHAIALMALYAMPELSKAALAAIMFHDLPEMITGDVPGPMKRGPLAEIYAGLEARCIALNPLRSELTERERQVIHWCDKIDGARVALDQKRLGNLRFVGCADVEDITRELTAASLEGVAPATRLLHLMQLMDDYYA